MSLLVLRVDERGLVTLATTTTEGKALVTYALATRHRRIQEHRDRGCTSDEPRGGAKVAFALEIQNADGPAL
jgi:hypothetical protein